MYPAKGRSTGILSIGYCVINLSRKRTSLRKDVKYIFSFNRIEFDNRNECEVQRWSIIHLLETLACGFLKLKIFSFLFVLHAQDNNWLSESQYTLPSFSSGRRSTNDILCDLVQIIQKVRYVNMNSLPALLITLVMIMVCDGFFGSTSVQMQVSRQLSNTK